MNRSIAILLLICLQLFTASSSTKQPYKGFHVIKVQALTVKELHFLLNNEPMINVWNLARNSDGLIEVTVHVDAQFTDETYQHLLDTGLNFELVSGDLQSDIDLVQQLNDEARSRALNPYADFTHYYSYDELQVFLQEQAALCGSHCSVINIGTSFEGREVNLIKLTGAPDHTCQQKPTIWIDAGIHAREWISHSTAQYIINKLIEEYDTDSFVKEIRDRYDWYILPCINPDGYVWTWSDYRLWRKTRQTFSGTSCIGTDANRNFDFHWMTVGASDDPCSDTFAGPEPFSEPETKAVNDYMLALNGTWHMFITLHSYGQLWMCPYGYTETLPENYDSLATVGNAAVQAIRDQSGERYDFGAASTILYPSSGTSRDWAAGVPRIPYVYTLELRSENSFVLPPSQIIPTGDEIWAGLKTAVDVMHSEYPGDCIVPAKK